MKFSLTIFVIAVSASISAAQPAAPSNQLLDPNSVHAKAVSIFLPAMARAGELETVGDFENAQKQYVDALAKPDLMADSEIFGRALAEIERLNPLVHAVADAEASALIGIGDLQMSRGQYVDADATYAKVVAKKAAISPGLFATASAKDNEARQRAVREPTVDGTLRGLELAVGDVGIWLFKWSLYAATLLGTPLLVAIFVTRAMLGPQPDIFLSLEDKTASSPGDAADAALSEEMRRQMVLPRPTRQGLRVEMVAEQGGTSFGQALFSVELPKISSVLTTATPFTFGPFGVNVFAIFEVLRPLIRRRHNHELFGSLSPQGDSVVCVVELVWSAPSAKKLPSTRWEASSPSSAPLDAIRSVAIQIMLALDDQQPFITNDWRSLKALSDGIQLMRSAPADAAGRTDSWNKARTAFEAAVLSDRNNWLARMNLGDVLRKLGLPGPAAEQFAETLRTASLPSNCIAAVKYNQAAALQKMDDEEAAKQVESILREVQQMANLEPTLKRLSASALLAAQAERFARRYRGLDRWPGQSDETRRFRADLKAALVSGHQIFGALETQISSAAGDEDNVVLAVALNALGELESLGGAAHQARDLFRRARTLLPLFVAPALNLAALYIQKNRMFGATWAVRAERLLLDIRTADPDNRRAAVLLGVLYSTPVFARYADAETLLRAASPDVTAALRLGGLCFDQGKFSDAVSPLLSAISLDPGRGSAKVLLTRVLLELPDTDRQKCMLLMRAQGWMLELSNSRGQTGRAARSLVTPVEKALAKCSAAKDPATRSQVDGAAPLPVSGPAPG